MKIMKEILAKNLKNEMDTRNITQTDLAKYLGCSISNPDLSATLENSKSLLSFICNG